MLKNNSIQLIPGKLYKLQNLWLAWDVIKNKPENIKNEIILIAKITIKHEARATSSMKDEEYATIQFLCRDKLYSNTLWLYQIKADLLLLL